MTGRNFGLVAVAALAIAALAPVSATARGGQQQWGEGRGPAIDFSALDADGDGKVTEAEVQAHRQAQVTGMDANGDGMISVEELTAHMMTEAQARIEEAAQRRIAASDADGDGLVSAAELMAPPVPARLFDRMDADGDGAVSQAEFDAALEKFADRRRPHRGGDRRGN